MKEIPSERQLAEEFGVSYMTVRRAVQELLQEGLVERQSTCRLQVPVNLVEQGLPGQIAFLTPAFISQEFERWRMELTQVAGQYKYVVRSIMFRHWDDPVITDALDNFSGVFLYPVSEDIPDSVLKRLVAARGLVILGKDMSREGIPSVHLRPPVFTQTLLDHLAALGHRHIDCFNTQPIDQYQQACIAQWHRWMVVHHYQGELINEPVPSYGYADKHAYQVIQERLQRGLPLGSALFCITFAAALGATRALYEHGLHIGKDIALCALGGDGLSTYLTPSITTLRDSDLKPYINICMDWIARGAKEWVGPLLLHEEQAELAIGESTTSGYRLDIPVTHAPIARADTSTAGAPRTGIDIQA